MCFIVMGSHACSAFIHKQINSSAGKHEKAEIIVRNTLQDDLDLDTVAYNTFIKAMVKAGKWNYISIYLRSNHAEEIL